MTLSRRPHIFGHLTAAIIACNAMTSTASMAADIEQTTAGPIRLVDGTTRPGAASEESSGRSTPSIGQPTEQPRSEALKPAPPSEFEAYVSGLAGTNIRRLGTELMLPNKDSSLIESNRQVPPDYVVGFGDEIQVTTWGSVDADLRLTVDRAGRIVIPRVGPVVVAGVRHGDLNELLTRRVGQVFKNFQLSASLGKLRSIRYYVTGFVARPGAYSISSLATVMSGLAQAGGPSSSGSFRNIELRRHGQVVSRFDLYDLMVKGEKRADVPLHADDVLHVGPVGPQVGLIGSFNRLAVVELKDAETIADAASFVGGLATVADTNRLSLERLSDRNNRRVVELALPESSSLKLANGDVLRAFNNVSVALPQARQYKRVRVEGEVARPGEYILPPGTTLPDMVAAAGGLTREAYLFGAEFTRESVRRAQEVQYDRVLRDLETDLTRAAATQKVSSSDGAIALSQQQAGTAKLIEHLRAMRPTGRIVLDVAAASAPLPALMLEDGDRLYVPATPNTVSVFGSVFNGGSYLIKPGNSIEDVVRLAGGPTRGADVTSMFVLRANGRVISARQSSSGWFGGDTLPSLVALPGDAVFVPEQPNKTTFMQEAKDWTQILAQFGLGAAALKTIKN